MDNVKKSPNIKRYWQYLQHLLALLGAFVAGILLFQGPVIGNLSSIIINMGLDTLRSQLIAALVMTAGAALVGAMLGQHKLAAIAGAGIVFGWRYLTGFVQVALQPAYDPGGHLELLNRDVLIGRVWTISTLALLGAFIGAAVGIALAEVVLVPPMQFLQLIWQRAVVTRRQTIPLDTLQNAPTAQPFSRTRFVGNWIAGVVMIVLLVAATNSGDLFLYSPDINLHTPPNIPPQPHTQGTAAPLPAHGTIKMDQLTSVSLGGQIRQFQVYLPPSYNTPQGQTKHYPVLYLLHGSPGAARDWIVAGKAGESADTLIATGKIAELILVMPDGNGRQGATSEWADSFDHRQLIETYVTNDLVQYIDQHYRTQADATHRGIGGLSMGGYGAMNIAIHYPNVFGVVIALGGYYRAEGAIWGNNAAYIQANSPIVTIRQNSQARKLQIYLGAATEDQPYYTYAKQFSQVLDELHIPYQFDLVPGHHAWSIWQAQMYRGLLWLKWK